MSARDIELNTQHLVKCSGCKLRYEGDDDCPWCGDSKTVKETGRLNCKMCDEPINPAEAVHDTYPVHGECRSEVAEMFE